MQRIMIIGGSGTGKSTLAREIGAKLNVPVVHLDRHYWSPGWVAPEPEEWRRRVAALAASDSWVIDGNYSSTFDLRLPRADALVWLDLPRWIYFPRAVKRLLVNYGRERGISALAAPNGSTSTSFSTGSGTILPAAARARSGWCRRLRRANGSSC